MRVLIAEDSTTGRLVLRRAVERLGHTCIVARDGEEAWALFQAEGADAIISDWVMPRLEGPELCERVRAAGPEPYVYFAFLTVLNDKQHTVNGIQAGADDFLGKPLDLFDLQACLIAAQRVTTLHRRLAEQARALEASNRELTAKGRELEELNHALFATARTDALTGLGNRLRLQEDIKTLHAHARRYGSRYSVALFDLDRFKAYNDLCGHLVADGVLRSVSQALTAAARGGDSVYRYGGEEIVAILPEQELTTAVIAAERLRRTIEELALPHPGNSPWGVVTFSVGVAEVDPLADEDELAAIDRADTALYLAKSSGRNRVAAGPGVAAASSCPPIPVPGPARRPTR